MTCIFLLNQREIHSKTKHYIIIGYIALRWLCIFMLLHKEIERLKIKTYDWFPYFRMALVIDHHLHHHHLLLQIHYHHNRQCHLAMHDEMESRCSKSIEDSVTFVVILENKLMFSFKNIVASTSPGLFSVYYKFQLANFPHPIMTLSF